MFLPRKKNAPPPRKVNRASLNDFTFYFYILFIFLLFFFFFLKQAHSLVSREEKGFFGSVHVYRVVNYDRAASGVPWGVFARPIHSTQWNETLLAI